MKLIDADKLQAKHYLQRTEHPIGYEGTQAVYDYTDVLAYDIESAEIVEAIPIEWLENFMNKLPRDNSTDGMSWTSLERWGIKMAISEWEKENETNAER